MHYYLADRAAQKRHPGSRALMLDRQGFVVETTTANVVLYREDSGLLLPPADKILPGISLAVLLELAEEWDIHYLERDLKPADVVAADEVFLTSTSPCMVPVVKVNDRPIGAGGPGAMFGRFMSAWNDLVGLDIIAQARQFAAR
jgi:branched-subunit amino acid aminotransferase/4-amino-4-deoxychorismate lyase